MLRDITEEFYSYIFPNISKIVNNPITPYDSEMNHIKLKVILLYAKQGVGKTETVRAIVEKGVEKYGLNYVNASSVEEGQLRLLLEYGLNDKLINILFCDNITLAKVNNSTIRQFFKIRHYWKQLTNRNYGYLLAILATHRIHATPLELRTNLDAIIFRNAPTSPWDRSVVKKFIGEEATEYLDYLDIAREENEDLYKISIVNFHKSTGLLITPLATANYLKRVVTPNYCLLKPLYLSKT